MVLYHAGEFVCRIGAGLAVKNRRVCVQIGQFLFAKSVEMGEFGDRMVVSDPGLAKKHFEELLLIGKEFSAVNEAEKLTFGYVPVRKLEPQSSESPIDEESKYVKK